MKQEELVSGIIAFIIVANIVLSLFFSRINTSSKTFNMTLLLHDPNV